MLRGLARFGLAAFLVLGCSTEKKGVRPSVPGPSDEAYSVSAEVELAVGQIQGLVSWRGDVVVICPYEERRGDRKNCEVNTLDAKGNATRTGISGARTAERVKTGMLVLRPNLDLVVVAANGTETKIAEQVWMPSVAPEGDRLAYVQKLPDDARVIFQRIEGGQSRIAVKDETAYAPWVVPGTDDVVFVSARTGVASYFLAKADGSQEQLTNLGMQTKQKGFVPVALEQLSWLPGTKSAVFTAHYGDNELWKLDIASKKAELLGPGEYPNLESGGGVIAFDRGPSYVERPPRVVRYLEPQP